MSTKLKPCPDCVALVEVRAENARLVDFIRGCTKLGGELTAERNRLRAGLQEISEYETDWSLGPAQNVANLQEIAEAALKAPGDPR